MMKMGKSFYQVHLKAEILLNHLEPGSMNCNVQSPLLIQGSIYSRRAKWKIQASYNVGYNHPHPKNLEGKWVEGFHYKYWKQSLQDPGAALNINLSQQIAR